MSLTTIPPRFDKIGPTLRDIARQDIPIAEIRLNIPQHYRRFPGEVPSLPPLPPGVSVHHVDTDFGPATKVLPTVRDHRGAPVEILFCDDDQPYDPGWARRFLQARTAQPDACIAGQGYDLHTRPRGHRILVEDGFLPRARRRKKGICYRLFRLATLGLFKPRPYVSDGYVHILEGYRGALIRPDFIPPEAFDIPDILWTVDDPWLSGQMARRNVPIWLMAGAPAYARPYSAHFADRLGAFVYKGHGRIDADTACIAHLRATYGIWPDPGAKVAPGAPV